MHTQLETAPAAISQHFKLGDSKPRFEAPHISPQVASPVSPQSKLGDAISPPSRAPRNLQLRVGGDASPSKAARPGLHPHLPGDASPCKAPRGDTQARVSPETSPSPAKAPRGDLQVRVAAGESPSRLWFRRTGSEDEARALAQLLSLQQQQQQQQQQQLARQSGQPSQSGQLGQSGQPVQSSQPGQPSPSSAAAAMMGAYPRCRTGDGYPIGSPSLSSPRLPPRSPRTPDLSQSPAGSSHSSPHRSRSGYPASGVHVPNRELARRSQQWANLRCEAKVLSSALEELVASTVNDWSVESVEGVAGRGGGVASSSNDNVNVNGNGSRNGNGSGNSDGDSNSARLSSPDLTPTELSPKEVGGCNEQRRE
ncbi:unnamed protein product [Closterium sp. NIES-53]